MQSSNNRRQRDSTQSGNKRNCSVQYCSATNIEGHNSVLTNAYTNAHSFSHRVANMSAYPSANTSAHCKPITKPTHSGPTLQPHKRQRRRRRLRGPRRPIFRRTNKPESDVRLLEERQNLTESLPIAEHHTERPTDYPVEAVQGVCSRTGNRATSDDSKPRGGVSHNRLRINNWASHDCFKRRSLREITNESRGINRQVTNDI